MNTSINPDSNDPEFAQRWDDAMRRAFKGILTSAERRRILIATAKAKNV